MPYCSKCGTEVKEEYNMCPNCGNNLNNNVETISNHDKYFGVFSIILGVFMPVIGIILYAVLRNEMPYIASKFLKGSKIGFIIFGVIILCYILLLIFLLLIATPIMVR